MKNRLTQAQRILRHLKSGKKLTPVAAISKYGCMRLAARISELKGDGINIKTKMIKKNGKKYAQYRL